MPATNHRYFATHLNVVSIAIAKSIRTQVASTTIARYATTPSTGRSGNSITIPSPASFSMAHIGMSPVKAAIGVRWPGNRDSAAVARTVIAPMTFMTVNSVLTAAAVTRPIHFET